VAEVSTSMIMLGATILGLPVSGSHILIFALIGSARMKGEKPDRKSFRRMVSSWFLTFPVAAILSAVIYSVLLFFLINEASKLGEVYVIVARDVNVKKFKGESPILPEEQRLEMVQNLKNVKKAIFGKIDSDYLKIIEEINPDIIMLGPNQKVTIKMIKNGLKAKGLEKIKI
ncbi:unnamed protein product, partial [marine sediment metagenome]